MQSVQKKSFYHFIVFVRHVFLSFCYFCKDIFFIIQLKLIKKNMKKVQFIRKNVFIKIHGIKVNCITMNTIFYIIG